MFSPVFVVWSPLDISDILIVDFLLILAFGLVCLET